MTWWDDATQEDRIEAARALWDAGKTTVDIGAALGTTKNAIIGLAHRKGFTPRPSPIKLYGPPRPPLTRAEPPPKITLPPLRSVAHPPQPAVVMPPPKPVTPPEPPRQITAAPKPIVIRGTCQWIDGEVRTRDGKRGQHRFCGATVTAPGAPWCAKHRKVVFTRGPAAGGE